MFVTLQFLVHMLLCFYPTPTTDLEEPVQASPVGVLMDKKCEVNFFYFFFVLPAHVSASVSHKCLLKFSRAIQVEMPIDAALFPTWGRINTILLAAAASQSALSGFRRG